MSPVGHSLVGLAFAALVLPATRDLKWRIGLPVAFVALANLPDWPILNWGHDRYDISHSIFVNIALIGLVLLAWRLIPNCRLSLTVYCAYNLSVYTMEFAIYLPVLLIAIVIRKVCRVNVDVETK